jgi:hypothetical protein
VPNHHKRDLFNKLTQLKQSFKSVEEYYKEMHMTMMSENVDEREEQTMETFLNVLYIPVKRTVDFLPYTNMVELLHQATRVERQVREDLAEFGYLDLLRFLWFWSTYLMSSMLIYTFPIFTGQFHRLPLEIHRFLLHFLLRVRAVHRSRFRSEIIVYFRYFRSARPELPLGHIFRFPSSARAPTPAPAAAPSNSAANHIAIRSTLRPIESPAALAC